MNETDQVKWDRIYTGSAAKSVGPCRVLSSHIHLLPTRGEALDLACGRGGNALFLAACGLATRAWDISGVAIQALSEQASQRRLSLITEQRDVTIDPPTPESFDVIVVSRFLDRTLAPAISAALRARGLLFYQTFIREKVTDTGPDNPAYRLAPNELLQLFPSLQVLHYHEEGAVGDTRRGFRNEAMLVAQKRHC
ncbi:MAG: methyltransferase domain-containing protein [Gammaproteobacteria bacterium]|nr:methyltransferase domain-containing protein [Gammaproteobacteria bacterium]MCY4282350.1 methyltransferase domain-containing protein [Gammaproteobacteria bacterium]